MWTFYACDVRTGLIEGELPLQPSGGLTRLLCDVGTGTLSLPVTDLATPRDWRAWTNPARSLIVAERDGVIVWGGIVWKRRQTEGPLVDLACSTVESYLSRRYVDYQVGIFENTDQAVILSALIEHANVSGIGLQVDAPTTGVPREWTNYDRYHDVQIRDAIDDMVSANHGIEWTVDLEWNADRSGVDKILRARYPFVGTVVDDPELVFESGVGGTVVGWALEEDAGDDAYANVVVAGGEGEGRSRVMSTSGVAQDSEQLSFGAPLIERRITTQLSTQSAVDAAALGELEVVRGGVQTIAVTASCEGLGLNDAWGLGDTCSVILNGPVFPGGLPLLCRVVGWDLDPVADQISPHLIPFTRSES